MELCYYIVNYTVEMLNRKTGVIILPKQTNEAKIITKLGEQFIIGLNDVEQSMGAWYTIFAQRIVPFLLFIIPVNVIIGRVNRFIYRYYPNPELFGTLMLLAWIVVMVAFLTVLILSPKAGTVIEYIFGFAYLYLAFRYHIHNNALGYTVLFAVITFLVVKTVFLGFKIFGMISFAGDKKNNIERDESGRVVQATSEKVFFTSKNETEGVDASARAAENSEFVFESVGGDSEENGASAVRSEDDGYFFGTDYNTDEDEAREKAVQESNDDFFFG